MLLYLYMVRMSLTSNLFNTNIKGGTATASGDAVNKVFTIPHGLGGVVPSGITVEDGSVNAIGARVITANTTNIIITYEVPPPSGTNNLSWVWTAIKVVT
jgi:hypothetical protein